MRIKILILLLPFISNCSSLTFWKDKNTDIEEPTKNNEQIPPKNAAIAEEGLLSSMNPFAEETTKAKDHSLELNQAKLWARVDELEGEVFHQKEKIRILEEGLMLGMVPSELRYENNHAKNNSKEADDIDHALDQEDSDSTINKNSYMAQLDEAITIFNSGRFGKSYLRLSKMEKDFKNDYQQGTIHFWIGKCWFYLKEYRSAQEHLSRSITQHPQSPVSNEAKLYLAKTEFKLGQQTTAVNRLQDIIQKSSKEEYRISAKEILDEMEREF